MAAEIMGVITITLFLMTIYLVRRRGSMASDAIMYHHFRQAHEQQLRAARDRGDLKTIETYFVTATRKFPYAPEAALNFAQFLVEAKRLDEALAAVETAHKRLKPFIDRQNGEWYGLNVIRVQILLAQDRIDAAEAALNRAIGQMPGRRHFMRMRLTIAERRGEDHDIIQTLTEIRDAFPKEAESHLDLFHSLMRRERVEEAEAALLHAQTLLPQTIDVHIPFARLAHARQEWEVAAARWAVIQQKFVLNAEGFEKGAEALRHLGREAEAEAVLAEHPGHRAVPWPREKR